MEGTFIEVEAFGDFTMKYTVGIFYTIEKKDIDSIKKKFCELKGLPSFDNLQHVPDYTYSMLSNLTDEFIIFLKKEGFKELQTKKVYFCD